MSPKRGRDALKPGTRAWDKRQAIWRHNALRGDVAMARANMNSITASTTATDESQTLAREIGTLLEKLAESLIVRRIGT